MLFEMFNLKWISLIRRYVIFMILEALARAYTCTISFISFLLRGASHIIPCLCVLLFITREKSSLNLKEIKNEWKKEGIKKRTKERRKERKTDNFERKKYREKKKCLHVLYIHARQKSDHILYIAIIYKSIICFMFIHCR